MSDPAELNRPNPPLAPTPADLDHAWDIHKDADSTLHNRINALMALHALLFGGFIAAIGFTGGTERLLLSFLTAFAGVGASLALWFGTRRQIAGIETLRSRYLLPHDTIYAAYFGVAAGRMPATYWLSRITPLALGVFWAVCFVVAAAVTTGRAAL